MVAFPPHRRGLALGIRRAAVPAGGLIGAAVLPLVAELAGWRWSLVTAGAAAAVGVVPLMAFERRWRDLGITVEPSVARGSALNRDVVLLTLWGGVFVSGQYALLAFLALDLQQRAGLALAPGSLLAAVAQGGGLGGRIGWGVLSDRLLGHGRKPLLLVLTGVALGSALLLAVLPDEASLAALVFTAALAGVGLVGCQGLWVTLIAESAEPSRIGASIGAATMGARRRDRDVPGDLAGARGRAARLGGPGAAGAGNAHHGCLGVIPTSMCRSSIRIRRSAPSDVPSSGALLS